MDEYLKRSDLLAEYDRQHKGPPGEARRLIAEAPAAAVAPVVYGRWDGGFPYPVYCSVCKSRPQMSVKTNYCPNCGARMDG